MRNHGSEFVAFNLLSKHLLDHLTRLPWDSNTIRGYFARRTADVFN